MRKQATRARETAPLPRKWRLRVLQSERAEDGAPAEWWAHAGVTAPTLPGWRWSPRPPKAKATLKAE